MSIDLAALLDVAGPLVAEAIDSSGTVVDVRRGSDAAVTVDPETLEVTDSSTRVLSGVTALIVAASDTGQPLGPGRTWEATRYRVFLSPDTVTIKPGDVVVVTESRDPALVKRRLLVAEVIADSVGVARVLDATLVGAGA